MTHDHLPILTRLCRYGGVRGEEEAQLHTPVSYRTDVLLTLYHIGRNNWITQEKQAMTV